MRGFIKENFKSNYTQEEVAIFIEAFINPVCLLKKVQLTESVYLFLLKISEAYPYCVIAEKGDKLYFQVFNTLAPAQVLYNSVLKCNPGYL